MPLFRKKTWWKSVTSKDRTNCQKLGRKKSHALYFFDFVTFFWQFSILARHGFSPRFFFQNTGALTLFLTLNHRKFLGTKWRTKNRPKNSRSKPPDRNFCRVDDFGCNVSARQKMQSGLSVRGFLAYFWLAILYPKIFCDWVSGKGLLTKMYKSAVKLVTFFRAKIRKIRIKNVLFIAGHPLASLLNRFTFLKKLGHDTQVFTFKSTPPWQAKIEHFFH